MGKSVLCLVVKNLFFHNLIWLTISVQQVTTFECLICFRNYGWIYLFLELHLEIVGDLLTVWVSISMNYIESEYSSKSKLLGILEGSNTQIGIVSTDAFSFLLGCLNLSKSLESYKRGKIVVNNWKINSITKSN